LSANGIKALTVLMWVVQTKISKDEVVLDKYYERRELCELSFALAN